MYIIKHGSGRDEPIETEAFTSDWEIADEILGLIKRGELEPDGSELPETISLIDDISEWEYDVYWADKISNKALLKIDEMWTELGKLWEDETKYDEYQEALKTWEARLYELSTDRRS